MQEFGIGILGYGTVGAGVAEGLLKNGDLIADRTGLKPVLRRIADLDIETDRGVDVPAELLTTDALAVINDDSVDMVIELIGGTGIAKTFTEAALKRGKPVVTANKALLAKHGAELFEIARQNSTEIYYGASVGGGRLAGPDLKDVGKRREEAWLLRFVVDPKGVIDSGDAYAQNLLKEAKEKIKERFNLAYTR